MKHLTRWHLFQIGVIAALCALQLFVYCETRNPEELLALPLMAFTGYLFSLIFTVWIVKSIDAARWLWRAALRALGRGQKVGEAEDLSPRLGHVAAAQLPERGERRIGGQHVRQIPRA
jgi:hypothetical protein